jgi:flagellar protein FlaG
MNSEVSNNLTLSSVTPVKSDNGSQASSANLSATQLSVVHPAANASPGKANQAPSLDSVKKAADKSNQLLQAVKLSVQYGVDNATKEVVIKVVDTDSGKIIRQIPSSEMLDFVKRLQDLEAKQKGAVIQTRA